ncbi:3-oxoacyl-ACP reductase FabG [Pseudoclavibacter alba]|uniref:3-oxoacyl-ACP reductase FabG n=1 Tax=Pseudoclavibacter albus TaxID=272241 RepID=UPI0019D18EBE|nr:3-oxoacyl-ACP reductase FabG [Pseudoclavibacter alba]MBN6777102.1 3-oxoacyl-ACP reductase FabG [Pseudoclavibacter alba]
MSALLEGRTAIVTGGTLGIGRGIAEVLRAHGAKVAVTGLTEEECAPMREAGFLASALDVRDAGRTREVFQELIAELGGLSILASNAGVYPQAEIATMSDEDLDFIFDINVKGTVHAVQAALPALEESGKGRIVLTSSITGNLTGFPKWSHYGATKAAQLGFMRSAAIELAPKNITVNAVLPGNILTPGLKDMGETYLERMARSVPLGFLGEPEDIGEAVAYLASDGARYVTGQSIIVDGGQVLPESPEALEDLR